tara:strand:- start:17958 stop:18929 length:972 start_codon:yes stop_codon:yes gene_type:complete
MKVLITGAGGFLGTEVTKQLALKGEYEIHTLSRNEYPHLNQYVSKQIQFDLSSNHELNVVLNEQYDAIFHIAGKVAMWGPWNDFVQTNIEATKKICEYAQSTKVKYLVYTSSPSVVFGNESIKGSNEEMSYPKKHYGMYGKSKRMAEEWILGQDWNFQMVALRPHLILGKGEKNLIPNIIEKSRKGLLKIVGDGENRVDIIDVRNAAEAHLCALESMINNPTLTNEAFFLGQGPVKIWEFINQILIKKGENKIDKKVSFKVAYLAGSIFEIIYKVLNIKDKEPPMTRFVALQLNKDHFFDHQKASNLLNWKPKYSIDELLEVI